MADIMSLGEVLIDLTQTGTDENGIPRFAAFPGGAPANVAVAASRLGAKAGFIGKVGTDSFGQQLRRVLDENSVDSSFLFETPEFNTTLAIVHVDDFGERSFAFYRQPGADTQLTAEEAGRFLQAKTGAKVLHFGSLSLTDEPSRQAALKTIALARKAGLLISYDPNFRPALWKDEAEAVHWMKKPLDQVDLLKVSDEELLLMTGTDDLEEGSRILAENGIALVLVTLGPDGVFYRAACGTGKLAGIPTQVADTNGAGDTFLGAVLCQLVAIGRTDSLQAITPDELEEILSFANRAAAKTCSRPGAIPAMPTMEELTD